MNELDITIMILHLESELKSCKQSHADLEKTLDEAIKVIELLNEVDLIRRENDPDLSKANITMLKIKARDFLNNLDKESYRHELLGEGDE